MRKRALLEGPSSPDTDARGGANEQLLQVGKNREFVTDFGQLPPEALREILGQRGIQEGSQVIAALGVRVIAEQNPADFIAHRHHGALPRRVLDEVGSAEIWLRQGAVFCRPKQWLQGIGLLRQLQANAPFLFTVLIASGIDDEKYIASGDLLARANANFGHHASDRSLEADLHLHRLEQAQRLPQLDAIPGFHLHRHHHGRRPRGHLADGLPAEAIGMAIDFDAKTGIGGIEDDPVNAIIDDQASRLSTLLPHRRTHHLAVQVNAVAPRPYRVHLEPVALTHVGEIDLLPLGGWNASRRDACRIRVEVDPRDRALALVGEN
ncbi:MAG: hypothetical protein VCB42_10265, partial [Myxococcota bacterium]